MYSYSSPYQEILLTEGIVRVGSRILEGLQEMIYSIYQAYMAQNFLNLSMNFNGYRDTFMLNQANMSVLLKKNNCPDIRDLINRNVVAYRNNRGQILGIQDILAP